MARLFVVALFISSIFSAAVHGGSLSPAPAWTNELFQTEAWNGVAVDSAGDINRDGFDDVIVGARYYDSPLLSAGIARVFYGNASGLSSTPAWSVVGPGGSGAEFGSAVAGAGDVNGDGFADVLVSAPGEDLTCCYSYQGAVYLYLGTATGLSTSPARSYGPGAQGFIYFGQQLTSLGDVNRDGYADFAVGSKSYSNGQSGEGAVFIYYGAATPPSSPSLILEGNVSNAGLGWVGRAGDVNGDTYPDVIVRGGSRVQIHYGSASGLSVTPSWTADPAPLATDNFQPVAGAGDVNNDGYDDILVSDFVSATSKGRVHLYLGSASGPSLTPSMTFVSPLPAVGYGNGIAGVGDVDGDGYDDVVIGANGWSNGQTGEGRAFLHRGDPSGLSAAFSWTGEANSAGSNYGIVSRAGDVNHDGLADVIIGAPTYANHGATFVYFGSAAACTPPAAPATLSVTATANSELTLNWTTVAGAHHYVISRALAACGTGTYERIGETETNVGTYVDRTALPGGLYSYVVTAATAANVCESAQSPCDDETVTGTCTVKPAFAGLQSVTQTDCGLVLSWTAATSGCPVPGNVRYHVYRNSSQTFTPSASNRIASCVSGTSFTAPMGTGGDYFIVRTEENGCTGANEDTNTVRKSGTTILNFFDNLENPRTSAQDAYWSASGPVNRSTCKPGGGTYSYRFGGGAFCNSYNAFEQATLTLGGNGSFDPNTNGFRIPQAWTNVSLTFNIYYDTVAGRDGALLQYSTNGANGTYDNVPTGATAGKPYLVFGGYNGTILSGTTPAWTGASGFFVSSSVNLDALAGQRVWFRWVWRTGGSSSANWGIYVDDVRITGVSTTLQSVTIATPDPTTFCWNAGNSVVTATPNGGGPPWTYEWGYRTTPGGPVTLLSSFHQKTHTLWGTQFPGVGTYYVVAVVTPVCGNPTVSNELPVTLTATPPTPTITPSGPTTFCEGEAVTLTAPGGFTYLWSPGNLTTQSILVTQSGSYTVRVSNASNCDATSSPVVVTVNPPPSATITPSGPTTFCDGGSVTLTASAGDSWLWSNGATTQSIDVTASGDYSVTVTAAGCSATSSATSVIVNDIPPAPAITPSAPTIFCDGGSVTLTANAGDSWLWSNGATTQSIDVTVSGNYTVTVANANGCSATSAATTVTVNPVPPTPAITPSGPTAFCDGGSVTLTAPAGFTYLWSNDATTQSIDVIASGNYTVTLTNANGCSATSAATSVTVNPVPPTPAITPSGPTAFCDGGSVTLTAPADFTYLWSNGATTQSIDVIASGNYSVTVTNANGCSATSAATTVTVNPVPPTPAITPAGPTTFCDGGSVTLTAPAGFTYLWSNGATTQSIDVIASGSFSVTVTNANGCSATSAATSVTVNPVPPIPTITPSGPTTFCDGGSVTLTAPEGFTYLWSNGATTQSIDVTASGNYSVTITNANGCSATSAATTVTVNALPAAPTISPSGPTTFCEGGSVTLTAPAGFTYLWSNGATTQSINATASGNYSVTVTNANSCSATSAATAVTVNPLPQASVSANGPTTFCDGGSVTLTAPTGFTYLWSTGATTQSINATTSGSYTVTVTNANGCSATSAATNVIVNALPSVPTISPSGPTTFCQGGSVTLTAPAGFTYLWSNGATTQSINATASGNYSVTVTNANGCSRTSAATTVTVNALPAVPSITPNGATNLCPGASVRLSAPAGYASYLWSNGSTAAFVDVTNATAGTYSVTVTNASGCSRSSAPVTVTNLAATSITTQPANKTISRNTTTTISIVATGAAPLQYQWYEGASGNTSTPVGTNSSSLTVGPFTKKGTKNYWVRVSSATCTSSTVNSQTAVITIN